MLKVITAGPNTLFQDAGRYGLAGTGVSPSGVFDRMSAARANHAMGNSPGATVLEVMLGGLEVEALAPVHLIVTGVRSCITLTLANGKQESSYSNTIIDIDAGDRLLIHPADHGMRGYLAIRGGFQVPAVLGSTATDQLSHLGPAPVRDGDLLEVGSAIADDAWWPLLRQLPSLWSQEDVRTFSVVLGPRSDWFTPESISAFFTQTYTVDTQSNRIGVRLTDAQPLERYTTAELPSEGMVRGSIQVPPDGMPVIFGPDYPVTGGYPVIGVLSSDSSDHSAQCAPGDRIRFHKVN